MKRALTLGYGAACYAVFFGSFLYLIGWLGDLVVPRTIDSHPGGSTGMALAIDVGLIALFGLQHSVMARQGFKRWWTRFVPRAVERSTYVLITSLVLMLTFWQWRALPATLWDLSGSAAGLVLTAGFFAGIGLVLVSTFVIDHFDLFGLKQVWNRWTGRPHQEPRFQVRAFYRFVRHPLYVGWLLAFWCAPVMTVGHLVYALGQSAYIVVAIWFEERDLVALHGRAYAEYKARVPMLLPLGKPHAGTGQKAVPLR